MTLKPARQDEALVALALEQARDGSVEDAHALARWGAEALEHAEPMVPSLREYLVTGLREIGAGKTADRALLVKRGQGKSGSSQADRLERFGWELDLAREVERLIREGVPTPECFEVAGEAFGVGDRTASKVYYKHRELHPLRLG